MATQNSITRAASNLTIDPKAVSDSYIQLDINTTNEFRFGVYDTDGSFRLSQGNALGTNDTFIMTDDGEQRLPLQPAFLAILTSNQVNVTGDGFTFVIISNNVIFDQASNYNNSTGQFTAPIDGLYHFLFAIKLYGLGAAHTDSLMEIQSIVGPTGPISELNTGTVRNSSNEYTMTGSSFFYLDAGDDMKISITVGGGTRVVSVSGDGSTFMAAYLCV